MVIFEISHTWNEKRNYLKFCLNTNKFVLADEEIMTGNLHVKIIRIVQSVITHTIRSERIRSLMRMCYIDINAPMVGVGSAITTHSFYATKQWLLTVESRNVSINRTYHTRSSRNNTFVSKEKFAYDKYWNEKTSLLNLIQQNRGCFQLKKSLMLCRSYRVQLQSQFYPNIYAIVYHLHYKRVDDKCKKRFLCTQ
jgi:hypothetical protein